ncbi:MAG: serine hydrolase domain-containing protein, partial [Gammaproteobacteria bacterium]|nr:serine hydrolase domain-containing protein [Gammaproteobacteria bacterium]
GISLGTWFRHELADPLGLDFAIGLAKANLSRCADVLPARVRPGSRTPQRPGASEMMRDFNDPSTPTGAAFQNPAMGPGYMNSIQFRQAEIPAANGHGTARSVARLFDGLNTLVSADTLAEATATHSFGADAVLKSKTHFGLGFMLYDDEAPLGLRPGTFGHAGAGGSMAFHDPDSRVSFCFAMNQMEMGVITGGVSAMRTASAVYDCL